MKQAERAFVGLVAAGLLGACKPDQQIKAIPLNAIAVSTGDFDMLEEVLRRNLISYTPYEGYINRDVYDDTVDPSAMRLKSETLFLGVTDKNQPEILQYDAVFIDSGTRGMGESFYSQNTDDSIVANADAIDHMQQFGEAGRTLVVTDWAYDIIEAVWPDEITFLNEDQGVDGAEVGTSTSVTATITDPVLAEVVGTDRVNINFDFARWAVMQSVASDVTVYMTGDIEYYQEGGGGTATQSGVPLLVSFNLGSGRVIYSSFAWKAQRPELADELLDTLVKGLPKGTAGDTGG